MHTEGMPCGKKDRDWGDVTRSQETPKAASKLPEARRKSWDRFSLTTFQRNQPCQHLDLGSLPLEPRDSKFLLLKVLCYGNPSKLM